MNRITRGEALIGNLTLGSVQLDKAPLKASITVGAEAGNVINVAVQLQDMNGNALANRASVLAYLSDDANGDSVAGTAPDTVAIGTDGLAIPLVAGKCFLLTSEADGDIDINVTEDGADTWYLVLVLPHGPLVVSDAITFIV
jgi:hypothetical protein